ncbi:hypothetical protein [Nocardia stercoris]|uniref:hypothetical protein n=1 Tax=Nocardia stercoris TaxID=2483361 RepID=UPI00131A1746|nr:hypothetical protein [Nocardia stercoris]
MNSSDTGSGLLSTGLSGVAAASSAALFGLGGAAAMAGTLSSAIIPAGSAV